jgi:hypothetical protein
MKWSSGCRYRVAFKRKKIIRSCGQVYSRFTVVAKLGHVTCYPTNCWRKQNIGNGLVERILLRLCSEGTYCKHQLVTLSSCSFCLPRSMLLACWSRVWPFLPWRWGGSSTQALMPTDASILHIPQMIWVWRATVEWYWQGKCVWTYVLYFRPTASLSFVFFHLFKLLVVVVHVGGVRLCLWTSANNGPIVRFQVLTAASMMFRIVFWDVLPCKIFVDRRWWRQYAPLKRRSTIILHGSTSQKTILNNGPIVHATGNLRARMSTAERSCSNATLSTHIPHRQTRPRTRASAVRGL